MSRFRSCSRARPSAARPRRGWRRDGRAGGSRARWCRRRARPARRARPRCGGHRRPAPRWHAPSVTEPLVVEEPEQHGGQRRLPGAAGADDGDAAAGGEVEVDTVERPRVVAVARPQPAHAERRRGGQRPWRGRLADRGAERRAPRARARRCARTHEILRRARKARDGLERGERDQHRRPAAPVEPAGGDALRRSPAPPTSPGRSAVSWRPGRRPRCARPPPRLARGRRRVPRPPATVGQRAQHPQLVRAVDEVDHRGGQRAPRGRLVRLVPARPPSGEPWHGGRRQHQRDEQDQAGGRGHPPHQRDARRPATSAIPNGGTTRGAGPAANRRRARSVPAGRLPERRAAPPARAAPGAGRRRRAACQRPERRVVTGEPLGIAQKRPRQREELDAGDRESRARRPRVLRRARDQPRGCRGQPDRRTRRARAERVESAPDRGGPISAAARISALMRLRRSRARGDDAVGERDQRRPMCEPARPCAGPAHEPADRGHDVGLGRAVEAGRRLRRAAAAARRATAGKQSLAPQRSAIHSVPSGATSTMLIEPSTRPSGAAIQPVTVR